MQEGKAASGGWGWRNGERRKGSGGRATASSRRGQSHLMRAHEEGGQDWGRGQPREGGVGELIRWGRQVKRLVVWGLQAPG